MLDNCTVKERWSGVNQLIDRWLQERQEIVVQFCALSGVHELSRDDATADTRLERFCQLLVDYVSAGHFEIYYELIREAEAFKDGSADIANALMPQITVTTEVAMNFNDKYANAAGPLAKLPKHLSKLGEVLASRMELEDQLIDALHESHRAQVA
ncbi:MAG: regulator of sigma D [Oceanicoccus sp.]|jgi:regulator of sigma D